MQFFPPICSNYISSSAKSLCTRAENLVSLCGLTWQIKKTGSLCQCCWTLTSFQEAAFNPFQQELKANITRARNSRLLSVNSDAGLGFDKQPPSKRESTLWKTVYYAFRLKLAEDSQSAQKDDLFNMQGQRLPT